MFSAVLTAMVVLVALIAVLLFLGFLFVCYALSHKESQEDVTG